MLQHVSNKAQINHTKKVPAWLLLKLYICHENFFNIISVLSVSVNASPVSNIYCTKWAY